ncbi:MAG: MBL fold metallo-hydrolase [Oscillospiraceae bacterium]|nr:MBL fold metallo-hydrolase [Oscillospiraceae bacterium]
MTVTFLAHSGFLVEWDRFYTLFDWWKGELPGLESAKPLLVFASHAHSDHFEPHIFGLPERHTDTRFILSNDIRLTQQRRERLGIGEDVFSRVSFARPNSLLELDAAGETLRVRTFKSTDAGVAFLLCAGGKLVYHGGDLNWWDWEEDEKQYRNNMAANYRRSVAALADAVREEASLHGCEGVVDAAMAPLDPRLEGSCGLGVEYLLANVPVRRLFPMHMWENYDITERYCREHPADAEKLVRIGREGESFTV